MGYRERYNHRRKMGYSPEKARRMAKSGCYVATAVYGSYDCPEVWTLRRFRDNELSANLFGRLFIRLYYAISPSLVKLFGETVVFKTVMRKVLNKMVLFLQNRGIESTPYQDRVW